MILRPSEYFTVVRQLHDHTDTNTYFVRAVIRNARTDALISTVELTDRGDRRFSQEWQVPVDPSGLGFYISVLSTVYTDAGFTSKADNYGEEMNTYLVDERGTGFVGVGGGGAEVDYDKVRRIIREEIEAKEDPEPAEPVDLSPVSRSIESLISSIASLSAKLDGRKGEYAARFDVVDKSVGVLAEAYATQAKVLLDAVAKVEKTVGGVGRFERTDLSGVTAAMQALSASLGKDNLETFSKMFARYPEMEKSLKNIESGMKDFLMIIERKAVNPKADRVAELLGRKRA